MDALIAISSSFSLSIVAKATVVLMAGLLVHRLTPKFSAAGRLCHCCQSSVPCSCCRLRRSFCHVFRSSYRKEWTPGRTRLPLVSPTGSSPYPRVRQ